LLSNHEALKLAAFVAKCLEVLEEPDGPTVHGLEVLAHLHPTLLVVVAGSALREELLTTAAVWVEE
jgi:hypothetical protein